MRALTNQIADIFSRNDNIIYQLEKNERESCTMFVIVYHNVRR